MSIINLYNTSPSDLASRPLTVPAGSFFGTNLSKLHDEYSLNANPKLPSLPSPTSLGLRGLIPADNYKDNAPENRSF
tara:strand:+ start:687 stop:917 length:231 start_codon:yes stop_codon:yes gene_type:complete